VGVVFIAWFSDWESSWKRTGVIRMKRRIIIAVCIIAVLIAGILVWRHVEEQSRQQRETILEEYDRITGL
jgi:peptidoglycan/LPS O-acetylase OafA/YrhL